AARRAAHHVERRTGAGPDDRGDQPGRVRALLPRDGRPHRRRTAATPRDHGASRPVRTAARPAGLAARPDRAIPPHPAARRLEVITPRRMLPAVTSAWACSDLRLS